MSQLLLKGHNGIQFKLNVTQFRSPMSASINSVQTRSMAHHFPIRAGQPDIQFTVQFPSVEAHHKFRDFVRDHQRNTQEDKYGSSVTSTGAVTLFWPERDIKNWTGYIVNMPVREARFEYAPKVTFGVALVESMLSTRSYNFSIGNPFESIMGPQIAAYIPAPEDIENLFTPPTPPSSTSAPALIEQAINTAGSFAQTIISTFVGGR